jgi:hypothetical protein
MTTVSKFSAYKHPRDFEIGDTIIPVTGNEGPAKVVSGPHYPQSGTDGSVTYEIRRIDAKDQTLSTKIELIIPSYWMKLTDYRHFEPNTWVIYRNPATMRETSVEILGRVPTSAKMTGNAVGRGTLSLPETLYFVGAPRGTATDYDVESGTEPPKKVADSRHLHKIK